MDWVGQGVELFDTFAESPIPQNLPVKQSNCSGSLYRIVQLKISFFSISSIFPAAGKRGHPCCVEVLLIIIRRTSKKNKMTQYLVMDSSVFDILDILVDAVVVDDGLHLVLILDQDTGFD